jgi:ammonium transporter, Amt family
MHFIPFLRLRCDEETEIIGVDDAEMGEFAYDYVGIESELLPREEYNNAASGGSREPQHTHTASISQESHEKTNNAVSVSAQDV